MYKKLNWIMVLLLTLSFLLSACAAPATPTEAPPPPAPEKTDVVEPTAPPEPTATPEPTPVQPASDEQIDSAYNSMLAGMVKYNTIGVDGLAEIMIDAAPFLLDVRRPEEATEKGHIEGAILIPLRELGANLDKLPSFDTPIVSYCGSGWRCTIAMTSLAAMGWQDVKSLKDGSFGGWVEAGFPVAEGLPADAPALDAAQPDPSLALTMEGMFSSLPEGWGVLTPDDLAVALTEDPDLVLIDVRRAEELEENGYIAGSVNIPLEDFINRRVEWPANKDTPVAIYCGSGHRSTMAMTMMDTYGYSDVTSMKGGFAAWQEAGLPVEGGQVADVTTLLDKAYATFLANMVKYNTSGLEDLNLALAEEPPPYVLDVRQPEEAEEKGHIESAYLIPLRELGTNYDKLPSFDTPIVSYCGSGWRCTIAMTGLGALGWQDVLSLKDGSFGGWVAEGYPVLEGLPPEAEALNAAQPDPVLAAHFDQVFSNIPEGWGGVAVEDMAVELAENPELVLIDARTPGELAEKGIIDYENQVNIPLEEFISMKDSWPTDLDAPIIVYCGSGHRSTMAMTILWSYGFTDVRSMKGGFAAWSEAGLPVGVAEASN